MSEDESREGPSLRRGLSEDTGEGSAEAANQQESPSPQLVDQVFGLFKSYLTSQLDAKGQQLEGKSKIEKEATEFKFKGNRKQFELNSHLNQILTQIEYNIDNPQEIRKLVADGKERIKKRQKLVKLADRNKDGWLVVQEYESDDLASNSEDEKRIRKAKNAVEKKRKEVKQNASGPSKRFRSSSDNQLFRGAKSLSAFGLAGIPFLIEAAILFFDR
ncbi:hypothetical protein QZH41_003091 [Actinostola sp. cb2023]|nr:hypothetical protein QZH41_003091 [Actinostola sp. cb2023]